MENLKHYEQGSYNLSFIANLFSTEASLPDPPKRKGGKKVLTTDDAGLAILSGFGA